MREAVERIRTLLKTHPAIDQEFFLVNFTDFGASSLDILVYCFTTTTVWGDYLDARQDVCLKIMDILETMGLEIAFPSRSIYLRGVITSYSIHYTKLYEGLIKPEMVRKGQVILALSNPNPEITPEDAMTAGAAFAADGKSVNNALGFPGIFRGALNVRATKINNKMKIAAAKAIANCAEEGELVPSILHPDVHGRVAEAVERAALESGIIKPWE